MAPEKQPGQIAYEARFEGCALGPRGVSDAWCDLPPMTKAIWARVEERVLAALQSRAFEDGARTPSEPSPGLLMSMAMRYDHSLCMPGVRDWKGMPGLGEREPGRHARILANTMGEMRQLWEEVSGNGFYCPAREADYVASAKSCGVTFNEIGQPMALPLQPEGERSDA